MQLDTVFEVMEAGPLSGQRRYVLGHHKWVHQEYMSGTVPQLAS
jgi:hypothetical protein